MNGSLNRESRGEMYQFGKMNIRSTAAQEERGTLKSELIVNLDHST